jgi:hypothetical protein
MVLFGAITIDQKMRKTLHNTNTGRGVVPNDGRAIRVFAEPDNVKSDALVSWSSRSYAKTLCELLPIPRASSVDGT